MVIYMFQSSEALGLKDLGAKQLSHVLLAFILLVLNHQREERIIHKVHHSFVHKKPPIG